ncbi:MAG: YcnI family protein [Egibacteraceae bacterium]
MRTATRGLTLLALAGALLLTLAGPAFAHVTVRADDTQPGGFAKYTVRVPNESETGAATTRIEVALPDGYEQARVQPKPGWSLEVVDGVLIISGGEIGPGQFDEFSFSARNPEQPGAVAFPAVQAYSDGQVQNWTGPESADEPAPRVDIAAAQAAGGSGAMPIALAGLIAGLLGLFLGSAAFVRTRRPARTRTPTSRASTRSPA